MMAIKEAADRQIQMIDESLPKVVREVENSADTIASATAGMERIGHNLSLLVTDLRDSSVRLAETLDAATANMSEMADKTSEAATRISTQQAVMTELAQDTGRAASALQDVTDELKNGFDGMRSVQQAFLDNLDLQLTRHSQLMAGWLTDYAAQVEQQTSHRMDQWNKHTTAFTSTMLTVSQGLSDVIDEFETVRAHPEQRGKVEGGAAA